MFQVFSNGVVDYRAAPETDWNFENGNCKKCESGKFANQNKTECVEASKCGNGAIGNIKRECEVCPEGKYASLDKKNCVSANKCGTGNYGDSDASECKKCEKGKYANSDKTECVEASKCGAGFIGNSNGDCRKCTTGKYANFEKNKCVDSYLKPENPVAKISSSPVSSQPSKAAGQLKNAKNCR